MAQLNGALLNNLASIVGVLSVLLLIVLVLLVKTRISLGTLQKKYDFFTQGEEANIDQVLISTLNELAATKAELAQLQEKHNKLREQVSGCIQTVKLTRYDAYDIMGGKMSYSLLLADEKKDGIILTSIYGRDDNRCYAKDIKAGKSEYTLAEEEETLL